jgi:molybdopterin molybdotransferase
MVLPTTYKTMLDGRRNSKSEIMITVQEALTLLKKHMPDFGESKAYLESLSQDIIQEDIVADRDYPPFHRVMMDGIAISWHVYKEGRREFKVAGICAAGEPQFALTDLSTCIEVMTGAPLPTGSDLVVPFEHLKIENGIAYVTLELERTQMENVHLKSSDASKGDILLKHGEKLNGPHWGIAASVGYDQIKIKRKPRINIISTGNELVNVNSIPLDYQIRRSNAYALKASLNLYGHEVELSHLPDEESAIEKHYQASAKEFDLLIYSGGVSKGKFDYLPSTLKRLGVEEIFHGVSQRPGKPLWFGVDPKSKTTILGLPGNPVSSLVCLHRYFLSDRVVYALLTEEIIFKKDLTYFYPVKLEFHLDGKILAHPLKIKNSGEFSALASSDGFIELPKERSIFKAGEAFLFHSWRPL